MVTIRPSVEQLRPDVLREREVGGVVAVQVADLAAADLEGELAAAAGSGLDARPRSDVAVICSLGLISCLLDG